MGGVVANVARNLHKKHLKNIVESSMKQSQLDFKDLDAIAVTVKPGLPLSLDEGIEYAKTLCRLYKKPLIPIHHMEAHALTVRLTEDVSCKLSQEFKLCVLLLNHFIKYQSSLMEWISEFLKEFQTNSKFSLILFFFNSIFIKFSSLYDYYCKVK